MIKHIVMWKVKPEESASLQELAALFNEALQPLVGQIEGVLSIEVGADVLQTDASYDLALVATFEDLQALADYQPHPLHLNVVEHIIKPRICERVVIDFEC